MKQIDKSVKKRPKVIIVGGGFGGLYAARKLGKKAVDVLLIDKRNFHLFQPLLYQVATGGLSPGDIASPLRAVLSKYNNIRVIHGEVTDIDARSQKVFVGDIAYEYDELIVAAGAENHYFGNNHWAEKAPGLKSIEDALEIRRQIFQAFENAEKAKSPEEQAAWLNFVIIGGGPTGVELAGALAELAHFTLKNDFRNIDPRKANITLVEGSQRILSMYPENLAEKAEKTLENLAVTIRSNTFVKDIFDDKLLLEKHGEREILSAKTVLWGAGVKISPLAKIIARETGAKLDRSGRIHVSPELQVSSYPNIFIVGDMAYFDCQNGEPLPGVAPVAMQQGRYIANFIVRRLKGQKTKPFRYVNKGSLAVIGRNAAIADFGFTGLSGWFAWIVWVFVHIAYLIEFDNRLLVLIQWGSNYLTRKQGARLITGEQPQHHFSIVEKV